MSSSIRSLHGHHRSRKARHINQLDLFRSSARILQHPAVLTPFERALLLDERDSLEAREAYEVAIRVGDNIADAYCNLGVLAARESNYEESITCFTHALLHEADHIESHFNLANIYLEQGWLRPGEVHYRLALGLDPTFTAAQFNLALALVAQDRLSEAIEVLESYISSTEKVEHHKAIDLLEHLRRVLH